MIFVKDRPRPEIVFSCVHAKLLPDDGRSNHVVQTQPIYCSILSCVFLNIQIGCEMYARVPSRRGAIQRRQDDTHKTKRKSPSSSVSADASIPFVRPDNVQPTAPISFCANRSINSSVSLPPVSGSPYRDPTFPVRPQLSRITTEPFAVFRAT